MTWGHPRQAVAAKPSRRRRDVAALGIIGVGAGGLLTVAYIWHVLAGIALSFIYLATFGAGIGTS